MNLEKRRKKYQTTANSKHFETTGMSTSRGKLNNFTSRLQDRFKAAKEQHLRRASNAYPTPGKPELKYFTFANVIWTLVIVIPAFQLLGYMYFFTAGVYVDSFAALGPVSGVVDVNLGSELLSGIPLIGKLISFPIYVVENIVNQYETTSLGVVGLAIFSILQLGELIPTVIWESPGIMFWLLIKLGSHRKINIQESDTEAIRKMKEHHNDYYEDILDFVEDFRMWCFAIDVLVCITIIEFVRIAWNNSTGEWELGRFFEAAGKITFDLGDIDPTAFVKMLCSLFLLWGATKIAMKTVRSYNFFAERKEAK